MVCNQGGIGANPIIPLCFRSSVAEHMTFNHRVDGSNPSVGTMIHKKRAVMFVLLESRTSVNGQVMKQMGRIKLRISLWTRGASGMVLFCVSFSLTKKKEYEKSAKNGSCFREE